MNRCLHIGFPKTGTTTLQKHLFTEHSQIVYLGKPTRSEWLKEKMHTLIKQDSIN